MLFLPEFIVSDSAANNLIPNKVERNTDSISFHIISNHSPLVSKWGNQLDYLGIVVLMWGATIPSIYYGFLCDPDLQKIYWSNVREAVFWRILVNYLDMYPRNALCCSYFASSVSSSVNSTLPFRYVCSSWHLRRYLHHSWNHP